MSTIVEARTIARSLPDVYAYLAETRNLDQWIPGATDLKPLAHTPRVGDAVSFRAAGLSNVLTFDGVEPERRLAYTVRSAIVVLPVVIELEAIDAGTTRLTKSQTVEGVGFGRILTPLLKSGIRQRVIIEVDRIKSSLES